VGAFLDRGGRADPTRERARLKSACAIRQHTSLKRQRRVRRVNGKLHDDRIADTAEMIEAMKKRGRPAETSRSSPPLNRVVNRAWFKLR
jgi:hypothetical protein